MWAELAALPNVRLMPRTTVTGVYDGGTYGALERVGEHRGGAAGGAAAGLLLADRRRGGRCSRPGAIERPIAFPGNDRPGVMLAGAVRAYLNRWAVAPRRAAVFTACDDGWRTAADLAAAGVEVAALVDARRGRDAAGGAVAGAGRGGGGRRRAGARALREISVRRGGRVERIAVDCLAVAGRLEPDGAADLPPRRRGRSGTRRLAAFVPAAGAVPGLAVAGRGGRGLLDGGGAAAGGRGGGGGARGARLRRRRWRCRRRRTGPGRRRPSGGSRRRGGRGSTSRTT